MGVLSWLKSKLIKKEDPYLDPDPMSEDDRTPRKVPVVVNHEEQKTQLQEDSMVEKAREFLEETGKEVVAQGKEVMEDLKERWQNLDEDTKEVRENIKKKATEAVQKLNEFVDHTIEKAKEEDIKDQEKDQDKDGFADNPINFGSPLAGDKTKDSFFEKAEQFLNKDQQTGAASPTADSNETQPAKPTLELPNEDEKV
ncbi:MAG: hypothetical protein IPM48_12870 [Saprospiraceae bacterium]|nr:hypothetical protein [Saprospiraceae bacterium]